MHDHLNVAELHTLVAVHFADTAVEDVAPAWLCKRS